jgi:3'-5' exoribonuclease
MISDIKLNKPVSGFRSILDGAYLVTKCEFKSFANKPGTFLSCELSDRTGAIKAVMWDRTEPLKMWLKNKSVVNITGEVSTYKDVMQIVLKSISEANVYNMADLLPSLSLDAINTNAECLDKIHAGITDNTCKMAWDYILGKELGGLRGKFLNCPGGIGDVHHAYLGGLAEHSLSMMILSEKLFNRLNRDILLTGCLVHDMGKIMCYNWNGIIEMTDAGRLLHHTATGYGMLRDIYKDKTADQHIYLKLAHIIVAHHEEEGIRKTMFPEATAVAKLDDLDASTNFSVGFIARDENSDPETNWTKFCQLTGRQYYRPYPVPDVKEPDPPQQEML